MIKKYCLYVANIFTGIFLFVSLKMQVIAVVKYMLNICSHKKVSTHVS